MVDAFAFDEREWMRDELLIAADEWAEIMAGAEAQQAHDIRNLLFDLCPLRNNPNLSMLDRLAVGRAIDQLTAQLRRLRR